MPHAKGGSKSGQMPGSKSGGGNSGGGGVPIGKPTRRNPFPK